MGSLKIPVSFGVDDGLTHCLVQHDLFLFALVDHLRVKQAGIVLECDIFFVIDINLSVTGLLGTGFSTQYGSSKN